MVSCPACGDGANRASYLGQARFSDFRYEYRACAACDTLFVEPMPDAALLDRLYSPSYLEQHYSLELAGDAKSEELARELDETADLAARLRPGGRLLDVGCGAGQFLIAARSRGLAVEGLERHPATSRLASDTSGATVHVGTLDELARTGARYDMVHFADVLEHLPEPLVALASARRLLADGGCVIGRGPLQNQRSLFQLALRAKRELRVLVAGQPAPLEGAPGHVVLFTLDGWHALARRAGLRTAEERFYELHWPAPEKPRLQVASLLKELSLRASRSRLGRRLRLGDRVVSVLVSSER